MTHQLVFQFAEPKDSSDFDALIALGDELKNHLPKGSQLDGHDCGMGEFNLFFNTSDPIALFELLCDAIDSAMPGVPFCAGYRSFGEEGYLALWPPGPGYFSVS